MKTMTQWPEIITLWASEDDGRRRDRVLAKHGLLMKVVERKSLEEFRRSLNAPRNGWQFHPFDKLRTSLSHGLGYDLDRLESELDAAFGNQDSKRKGARITAVHRFHDQTLEALGDARRVARKRADETARKRVVQRLVQTTEHLYDCIEETLGDDVRREFIADGLRKTRAWLAQHKGQNVQVAAQLRRLSEARRRLNRHGAAENH